MAQEWDAVNAAWRNLTNELGDPVRIMVWPMKQARTRAECATFIDALAKYSPGFPPGWEQQCREGKTDNAQVGAHAASKTQVTAAQLQKPDGEFRAVCKIWGFRNGEPLPAWAGSGFLIDETTVVTAAHVIYYGDFRTADRIEVTVGFQGYESVATGNIEVRIAKTCAIQFAYFQHDEPWASTAAGPVDVGFIEVSEPFQTVSRPFKLARPATGTVLRGLSGVGYPYDMPANPTRCEDLGQTMYVTVRNGLVPFILTESGFLDQLDQFEGDSGGPIMTWDNFAREWKVIAICSNETGAPLVNRMGNSFAAFELALDREAGRNNDVGRHILSFGKTEDSVTLKVLEFDEEELLLRGPPFRP